MVIYTVLAKKSKKSKKIEKDRKKNEKIKNPLNNFWGPCQVLNIVYRVLRKVSDFLYFFLDGRYREGVRALARAQIFIYYIYT